VHQDDAEDRNEAAAQELAEKLKGKVVFVPDCRGLAKDFVGYMQDALLLAYAEDKQKQQEIIRCQTDADILAFCRNQSRFSLMFIIDQMNALEVGAGENEESVSNDRKTQIRNYIAQMTARQYGITSASANYAVAKHADTKLTNEVKCSLLGGMEPVIILILLLFALSLPMLKEFTAT
jgi:hypothetical protein